MKTSSTPMLVMLLVAFIVAGCGRGGSGKSASQVAARVNGDEISVHQINLLLARQSPASPEQAKTTPPQVLERLIDQRLLVQKAKKTKLDRDVQVMQVIEAAKSQILAQAYMERISSTASKVDPEDIRAFYEDNPALFSERRIYRFEEIVAQVPEASIEQLAAQVRKSKAISEVATWLKTQSIQFSGNSATRAAEQLPMGMLPALSRMKDGEIVMRRGPNGVAIVHLAASQGAAMNEQQATPHIRTYLLNRKRMELADSLMNTLRAAAKIEYVGDFGKTKPPSAAAKAPAPASVSDPLAPASPGNER